MSFLQGSISVRRYQVGDEIPATLAQTATLAIRRYAWRPIDDQRGEKESFGWMNPRNVLQDGFTYDDLVDGPYMVLGVRRDRKNYSKVLFKARRDLMFVDVKKERNLDKLSRQQRMALEEQLNIEMLKETSPQSTFSEMVWDTNSNLVFMGATSNTLCERIQELFEATFDLKVRPIFPSIVGAEYIASNDLEDKYYLAAAKKESAKLQGQGLRDEG
jgi:recombination associated protein RdgC